MIAEELINQMIPPLKLYDTVEKALRWMDEFRVNELPVVSNRKYKGLATEHSLIELTDRSQQLKELALEYLDVHVQQRQHFYDVMEAAIKNKIQVVPVLDDEQDYMGIITINDTLAAFGQMSALQGQGSILVLSMPERDYSLSQISRLIEEENVKILSAYVSPDELDPYKIKLTLKLNATDLSRIIATLERFEYRITAQFNDGNDYDVGQDRLDMLFKYLDI
ncbi:CBS domain-containing protein [Pontibacter ummariensis]|uniref:CBS domain-containing protein n=1 Tax=Pontibacter ummariensis TaxID=1610492 RepID=A0A239K8P2_9BACT|nr:CBS domain-containing protein [Pontibacter ummariensis]PRY06028.1 CBS domain-containing protein [Pontibacter ummariensis]SNT14042.1 CBS domain-containing protein [Pontibacter ummariensis]